MLETWELYGCYIQQVNYQTLNYGTSDAVTVALTLRFDNAIQAPLGSGVGTPGVQRQTGDSVTGIGQ